MPHLLLVDDDPNNLTINRDYFESRGFCVTACENAEQAYADDADVALTAYEFDILLLLARSVIHRNPGNRGIVLMTLLYRNLRT